MASDAKPIRVMSCNIRTAAWDDSEEGWEPRKELCADVIISHCPDVIAFQEMEQPGFEYLRDRLSGYEYFGLLDRPDRRDPVNTIFFRSDVFECIGAGGYYLSETPHVPGSLSWDNGRDPRLANWVRLAETRSGREMRFVNTHLDCNGEEARWRQARMINEDAAAYDDDCPQILTGDMNSLGVDPAIRVFRESGWRSAYETVHGHVNPGATFHGFEGGAQDSVYGPIDWIFVRGRVQAVGAEVVHDEANGRYPSDHYFVTADLVLL